MKTYYSDNIFVGIDPGYRECALVYTGYSKLHQEFFLEDWINKIDLSSYSFAIHGNLKLKLQGSNAFTSITEHWVEDVGGMRGDSADSAFKLGYSKGCIISGIELINKDSLKLVKPIKWQGLMHLGISRKKFKTTKKRSIEACKLLLRYSSVSNRFLQDFLDRIKKDHNLADACLISLYGCAKYHNLETLVKKRLSKIGEYC